MAREGWTKFHRNSEDHWLYKQTPFDPWRAWQHLWGVMASWKQDEILYLGRFFLLDRGQLVTSISHLARTFGWSRDRTRRFIKQLQKARMIRTLSRQGCVLITISNYATYQDRPEMPPPNKSVARHPTSQSPATDKEVLEGEEEKKRGAPGPRTRTGPGEEVSKERVPEPETLDLFLERVKAMSPGAARWMLETYEEKGIECPSEARRILEERAVADKIGSPA